MSSNKMIAVKLCCLKIVQVGNPPSRSKRMSVTVNSLPYAQISEGESVYLCVNQDQDRVELELSSDRFVRASRVPQESIKASTIAATPFWVEFDVDSHFVRVQFQLVAINRGIRKQLQCHTSNFHSQESSSIISEAQQSSAGSVAFCLESDRTLNNLESQRQRILENLFSKIKTT